MTQRHARLFPLLALILLPGCAAAVGAAAGAGAITWINDQTATAQIDADVPTTAEHARAVLSEMDIEVEEEETESDSVEFDGEAPNGLDIDVDIEEEGTLTRIEVTAVKNRVDYDKDYARDLLERIVARSR